MSTEELGREITMLLCAVAVVLWVTEGIHWIWSWLT